MPALGLLDQPLAADSAKRAQLPCKAPLPGSSTKTPSRPSTTTPAKSFASVSRGFKPLIDAGSSTGTPSRDSTANKRAQPTKSRVHTPFRAVTKAGQSPASTSAGSLKAPSTIALISEINRLERRLRVLQQALRYRDLPEQHPESSAQLEEHGQRWLEYGRAAAELLWTVSGAADGPPPEEALPRRPLFRTGDSWTNPHRQSGSTDLTPAELDALSQEEAINPLPTEEQLRDEVRRRVERDVRRHRSQPPSSETDAPKPPVRRAWAPSPLTGSQWHIGSMLRRCKLECVMCSRSSSRPNCPAAPSPCSAGTMRRKIGRVDRVLLALYIYKLPLHL